MVLEFESCVGLMLTARSLEAASDSGSPSLSAPPLLVLCLCLSLSKINSKNILRIKKIKIIKNQFYESLVYSMLCA